MKSRCGSIPAVMAALCTAAVPAFGEAVTDEDGYRLPTPHHAFRFPRDHGSHPGFKIEWWYITGHLRAPEQREAPWGFQATFFRYALQPGQEGETTSLFGTNQLHMAHLALADPRTRRFLHEERINRDGWDAFARVEDLDIRNGNWRLRRVGPGEAMEVTGTIQGTAALRLHLTPAQPLVVFGENGMSRKGSAPSAASWYLTFPRLEVRGSLSIDHRAFPVTGEAWMDHEISSSQLDADQVGWDWASLRLDDGREIMVYVLRTSSGTPDRFSTLAWIDEAGAVRHYGPDQFSWRPRRTWTSPETGATYPIDIDLSTIDPAHGGPVTFRLRPLLDAQEMVGHLGGISYWEGACEILDDAGSRIGEAYVELTGYAEDLSGALR